MTGESRSSKKIIINVDDLGLHPAVRRAVEVCAAKGSVTSASVLANGPDLPFVRPMAGVSLGAHLNVLRGRPLSPASEVPSLVNGRGMFVGNFTRFASRALRGSIHLDEVKLEWSRQVAHLRDRGFDLSHIDGEKHTHCFPALFRVACEVAAEHGIPNVRRSVELHTSSTTVLGHMRRMFLNTMCRRAILVMERRSTDAVWGISTQGYHLSVARLLHDLNTMPTQTEVIEIVCHPGLTHASDPALPESFGRMRVTALWTPEFRALCDEPWLPTLTAHGWTVTNFEGLASRSKQAHARTA